LRSLKNLSQLLSENHDIQDVVGATAIPPITSTSTADVVEFKDIHFHYPTQPAHSGLRGLNMTLKKGTTTAIVGPTGKQSEAVNFVSA